MKNIFTVIFTIFFTSNLFSQVFITQIYKKSGDEAIEITNFTSNTIESGNITIALYEDVGSGFLEGITPTSVYTVAEALAANQSVVITSTSFSSANINNAPVQLVGDDITNFGGGDDTIILTSSSDGTAWTNRYDVIRNFANKTSYVRKDDVTDGNVTYTESEWVVFIDDALDPYRPDTSGGPERHPHDPLISEVMGSISSKNQSLGYHRIGSTSYSNGNWDNGLPDRSRSIIISEDYNHTGSSLPARQLTVNSNSTLSITDNLLIVTEGVNLDSANDEIRLIDSGGTTPTGLSQLITTHSNSTQVSGNGRLMVDQNSENPSIYRYTYMGTPVTTVGASTYTIASVMKDGSTPTSTTSDITDMTFTASYDGSPTSPITISNRWIYTYGGSAEWLQKGSTGDIAQSDGFTIKGPGQPQNYTFVGTPKDGIIQTTVGANQHYILGNPYPSAISIARFIEDNINSITGTLYFWEQFESVNGEVDISGHGVANYVGGYSIRNIAVGISANQAINPTSGLGDGTYTAPGPYLPIGQGFFVTGTDNDGTVTFNNSQREYIQEGGDAIFFRNEEVVEVNTNRNTSILKLGMDYMHPKTNTMYHNQIGIVFMEGLSLNFEKGYDSPYYKNEETSIYLKFKEDENHYAIAGVQPISNELKIPLGIKLESSGDINLKIDEIENININIYLKDLLKNKVYQLNDSEGTKLNLDKGTYEDRFIIVFHT